MRIFCTGAYKVDTVNTPVWDSQSLRTNNKVNSLQKTSNLEIIM